jgi:hypothetical protein
VIRRAKPCASARNPSADIEFNNRNTPSQPVNHNRGQWRFCGRTHDSGSASNSGVDRLLDHLLENLKTDTICYPAAGDIRLSHFYGSACLMTRFATVEPLCQISRRCQGRDAKQ